MAETDRVITVNASSRRLTDPQTIAGLRKDVGSQSAARYNLSEYATGDGTTDDTAAIQQCFDAATAANGIVVGGGIYRIDGTVTLTSNADLSAATFNYYGTGVALNIGAGTSVLQRRVVVAPRVFLATKTANGWTAGSIGIRLRAAYGCIVTVPHVKNFDIGLQVYGQSSQGVSYCTVTIGGLDNNKVNLNLNADSTGWANQNTFIGGRFSHDSSEGTLVSGTRHILLSDIATSRPNNNTWINPSVESTNLVEYAIDVDSGQNNVFLNPRFEDTTGAGRLRWGSKALLNSIIGGFGVNNSLVVTKVTGATRNTVQSNDLVEVNGVGNSIYRLENASGSGIPVFNVYATGSLNTAYSATADWVLSLAALSSKWKNKGDTQERVRVEAQGRIYLGPGITTAPVAYLSGTAADIVINAGDFVPEADNTRSLGKAALQWLNVFARKLTVGTAQYTNGTGTPEGAVTAPVGSIYTRTDGGTGSTLYVKESGTGATGWVAK